MPDYYVVWLVRDENDETATTICRAVLSGRSATLVKAQAASLIPQAICQYEGTVHPDLVPRDVELNVTPLTEWVGRLRRFGRELPAVNISADEEND